MSTIARFRARPSKSGVALAVLLFATAAYAQIWTGNDMWRGWRGEPPRFPTRALKDGNFAPAMDDGSVIHVAIRVERARSEATIDNPSTVP